MKKSIKKSIHYSRGFTLIEVMIVVSIVGILAALAIPSYTQYVEQARRTDGTGALLQCAALLERNLTIRNTYATANVCNPVSPDGFYAITYVGDASTYTVTARPIGPQANDGECVIATVDNLGVQLAKDSNDNFTTATCWKK